MAGATPIFLSSHLAATVGVTLASATGTAITFRGVTFAIPFATLADFAGPHAAPTFTRTTDIARTSIMTLAIERRAATGAARPLAAGATVRAARPACTFIRVAVAFFRRPAARAARPFTAGTAVRAARPASALVFVTLAI